MLVLCYNAFCKEYKTIEKYFYKELYHNQEYEKIITTTETAINNQEGLSDWDYFYYALSLNRNGRTVEAIEVFKKLKLNGFHNTRVNDCIIMWIASEYFSTANNEKYTQDIKMNQFNFISENYKDADITDDAYSCYKFMLLKVCKYLNVLPTRAESQKIVDILALTNFDRFSEEERIYKDNERERPYFSEKEALYTNLIKAYWNLKEYKLCSEQCKIALELFKGRLHHKNNIWFYQKQLICDIKIKIENNEDYESDLTQLKINCRKSKHFSSLKHLGDVYELIGDYELALSAYSEAYLYGYDYRDLQLKLGVLKEIAIICENTNNTFIAKQCYALIIKLRRENNWDIKRDIQSRADFYSINEQTKIKFNDIINFCINNLSKQKYLIGRIIKNNQIDCAKYKGKYISFNIKEVLNPKFYNNKYINGSIVAFKFSDFNTGNTKNIYIGARV